MGPAYRLVMARHDRAEFLPEPFDRIVPEAVRREEAEHDSCVEAREESERTSLL
jgi:hypothetical protein